MRLNLPEFGFQIKSQNGKNHIFDPIRNKYVVLTPEEWVRQNVIAYLIQQGYPKGRMSVEKRLPGSEKRYDVVIYDQDINPEVLVECKAPHIPISQATIQQATGYIDILSSKHVILTNGLSHFHITRLKESVQINQEIPSFSEISH